MTAPNSTLIPATVFILGAGASNEANLPVGSGLKTAIAECLHFYSERGQLRTGDELTLEALKLAAKEGTFGARPFADYTHAGRRIASAMPQALSIDNFIDVHSGDKLVELCGKLAIVRTILRAEANSFMKLRQSSAGHTTLSFQDIGKTYFSLLFQLITENCKFADLPERLRSVCFVIFNYDRCIEHYLYYAVQNYYGVAGSEAAVALADLRIYHPYGTVGALPWQDPASGIDLGAELPPRRLLNQATQIKTFTEGTDTHASDIVAIREAMRDSDRVVFLGFAFHKLNVQLLAPDMPSEQPQRKRTVFGTAHGISTSDVELVTNELASRLAAVPLRVALRNDLKCAGLFGEYWRSLSFA